MRRPFLNFWKIRGFFFLFFFLPLHGVEYISRPEFRWAYQYLGPKCYTHLALFRFDEVLAFSTGATLFLRLDIPFLWFHCRQIQFIEVDQGGVVNLADPAQNVQTIKMSNTEKEQGLADLLTKILYTNYWNHFGFGIGSEFIFPTAQARALGTGKYQACPTIDLRYNCSSFDFPKWICLISKYEFSFAGQSKRPKIDIWFIQPKVELSFPHLWFLSFDSEMQFNVNQKKWFVPLDFSIAKGFKPNFFISMDYKVGIVTDFPVFKQDVEIACAYVF